MIRDADRAVRLCVYRHFIDAGRGPSVQEAADALAMSVREVESAYRRLDEGHALVLQPGTVEIWMAMPFSALETTFRVTVGDRSWWANCAWDALGVPAMLGGNAEISTRCGDCDEADTLLVEGGELKTRTGVIHFALPVSQWWDDIGFT